MKGWHWLWLLALIPLAIGVARLRFDVEVLNLLPKNLPVVEGLKVYQKFFPSSQELIVALEQSSADSAEQQARALAQILREQTNLVRSVTWQPPGTERPGEIAELIGFAWLNQSPENVSGLASRFSGENLTNWLAETREQLATSLSQEGFGLKAYDPFGLSTLPGNSAAFQSFGSGESLFANEDGTFRILLVQPKSALATYRDCIGWMNSIRAIISEAQRQKRIAVAPAFTGGPAFTSEISSGMERDMAGSCTGTLGVIAVLFWLTHRRLLPLIALMTMLLLILGVTLAAAGLIFSSINVISLGFAALLAGLAEDYGIVLFEEAQHHPSLAEQALRRLALPGIAWSTVTTVAAFVTLNLSALPGLGQLGSLVAVGTVVAAILMLFLFLPALLRWCRINAPKRTRGFYLFRLPKLLPTTAVWMLTLILAFGTVIWLSMRPPQFDRSSDALRPRNSAAYATARMIKEKLVQSTEPLWVVVPGKSFQEVSGKLNPAETELKAAQMKGLIEEYTLPNAFWPNPANQRANKTVVERIVSAQQRIWQAGVAFGFTSNALAFTENVFNTWKRALRSNELFFPTNETSELILSKFIAQTSDGVAAAGLVRVSSSIDERFLTGLSADLRKEGIYFSGWQLLGRSVFDKVRSELPLVFGLVVAIVAVSLWLAFKAMKEVLLSFAALAFSFLCLGTAMDLLGWHWNLMNLMALPLILGLGVDFSIHIQIALRRAEGNLLEVQQTMGRALLLAGTTTIAGFVSLTFSQNLGIASLGKVCGLGITLALLTAVFLLPVWNSPRSSSGASHSRKESSAQSGDSPPSA